MGVGTSVDVCSAFLVTFCTPYILNGPHIQAGARTAYIWMGLSILGFFFFLTQLPELKVRHSLDQADIQGRSLEEVDELFEKHLWAWQFRNAETTGIGARIRQVEQGRDFDIKAARPEAEPRPQEIKV